MLLEEWLHRFPTVLIHRNADDRKPALFVPTLKLHVPGDFNFATRAPRGPEVEQDYPSFVMGQCDRGPFRVAKSKVWSGLASLPRRGGSGLSSSRCQQLGGQGHSPYDSREHRTQP